MAEKARGSVPRGTCGPRAPFGSGAKEERTVEIARGGVWSFPFDHRRANGQVRDATVVVVMGGEVVKRKKHE